MVQRIAYTCLTTLWVGVLNCTASGIRYAPFEPPLRPNGTALYIGAHRSGEDGLEFHRRFALQMHLFERLGEIQFQVHYLSDDKSVYQLQVAKWMAISMSNAFLQWF